MKIKAPCHFVALLKKRSERNVPTTKLNQGMGLDVGSSKTSTPVTETSKPTPEKCPSKDCKQDVVTDTPTDDSDSSCPEFKELSKSVDKESSSDSQNEPDNLGVNCESNQTSGKESQSQEEDNGSSNGEIPEPSRPEGFKHPEWSTIDIAESWDFASTRSMFDVLNGIDVKTLPKSSPPGQKLGLRFPIDCSDNKTKFLAGKDCYYPPDGYPVTSRNTHIRVGPTIL